MTTIKRIDTIRNIEFGNPGDAIQRKETVVVTERKVSDGHIVSRLQTLVESSDAIVSITYVPEE